MDEIEGHLIAELSDSPAGRKPWQQPRLRPVQRQRSAWGVIVYWERWRGEEEECLLAEVAAPAAPSSLLLHPFTDREALIIRWRHNPVYLPSNLICPTAPSSVSERRCAGLRLLLLPLVLLLLALPLPAAAPLRVMMAAERRSAADDAVLKNKTADSWRAQPLLPVIRNTVCDVRHPGLEVQH